MNFTVFSVSANILGTSTVSVCIPLLSQRAAHSVVWHASPVSKYPALSARACLRPCLLLLMRGFLYLQAGALLTRIHTASSAHFSIAVDVLLLHEFVGHEQNCLYSVTCCSGSCYRSSCFLHPIAKGQHLIPACCLPALASNRSLCELCRRQLITTPLLPNYPCQTH